jgi:hypothetical protein
MHRWKYAKRLQLMKHANAEQHLYQLPPLFLLHRLRSVACLPLPMQAAPLHPPQMILAI